MKRLAAGLLLAALTGCTPLPDSYPVPEQRSYQSGPEPGPLGAMVVFSDPRSMEHIVGGFLPAAPDQTWRWAGESPTVKVRVSDKKNLRLRVNFTFPGESHTPLLPITVRFFVNDHLVETVAYRTAGILEFKKAVPEEWLIADNDNLIRCEVSPVYVAKADQAKLSMIVSEIGLERNE